MSQSTDYYDVLGVARDAGPDEIKKAFRSRAREVHPDTSDHDDAEERFKKLNEAYEVLSDPEKRQMYDRFGTADPRATGYGGFDGGFGGGFGDVFSMFFDGVMGADSRTIRREGRDMAAQVTVTLLEAADGATKEVRYTRSGTCGTCNGSGAAPGGSVVTCPDCGGAGQVRHARRTILGTFESIGPCQRCGTTGSTVDPPCTTCGGDGRANAAEAVPVSVPPGVLHGARIRVPGKGEAGFRGAATGDLYVSVRVQPHEYLHRDGDDLHCRANVAMTLAALGGELSVPGLRGPVSVKVHAGAQNGDTAVAKGAGMPRSHGASDGDLVVHMNVVVPRRLNKQQRELLEQLSESLGDRREPSTLDRIRDWLRM